MSLIIYKQEAYYAKEKKMTKTTIERVISTEHIYAVETLANAIWNQHFVEIIGQDQVDYMLMKFQSAKAIQSQIDSGYEYYIASQQGHFIAYIGLIPNDTPGKTLLSKIYVQKKSRGTGVGAQLLEFAKQRSIEVGSNAICLTVNRDNESSIDWYKRKGFKVTNETKTDIGRGFYMDDYIMEYELS